MKVPRVVKAMEYIDDDLVTAAATYSPKKKKPVWVKWGAMAACLALVLAIGIPVVIDQTQPMGGENVIEVVQTQADYLNVDQIYRPAVVQVDEPQFDKQFPVTLPCYSVISETVFTETVVTQFAEKAKEAGAFGAYSIEPVDGGFALINTDIENSQSYNDKGQYYICETFMQESGITKWLSEQKISVTNSPWYSNTFHLTIDGNMFADGISFEIDDDGKIKSCVLSIKEYATVKKNISILKPEEALANTFFVDTERSLTDETLHIANVEIMHINGMPIYFFNGSVVVGEDKYGASYDGYALAFSVNNANAEIITALVQQLIAE